jgi:choline kinase
MNKVIILAAGIGSRLRPLTNDLPKCMIQVNSKHLIERVVNQLKKSDNKIEINIITGYKSDVLKKFYNGTDINIIENTIYDETNNMFSLYLGMKEVINYENLIVLNADCIYDDQIVSQLVSFKGSCIAIDNSFYDEESMKVIIKKNLVRSISKEFKNNDDVATSIDLYKFDKITAQDLFNIIEKYIDNKDINKWTEIAINDLLQKEEIEVKPFEINGSRWYEIDTLEDLDKAEKLFLDEK